MNHKRKLLLLSSTLVLTQSLTACDFQRMDSFFASDRRLPEGSSVNFSDRHAPMMNPGGTDGSRHSPAQNGNSVENTIPTIQKSPVVPVATSSIPDAVPTTVAASASQAGSAPVEASPFAPPSADTPATSSYPALASVPTKPNVPPSAEMKGNFNSLVAEQKVSDADRTSLMHDQNATVMTSPQTGQLVANAAEATPAGSAVKSAEVPLAPASGTSASAMAANSSPATDRKFGTWLHDLFNDEKKPAPAPHAVKAMTAESSTRKVPVENQAETTSSAIPATAAEPPSLNAPAAQAGTEVAPVLHPPVARQESPAAQRQDANPFASNTAQAPLDSPPQNMLQPAQPAEMAAETHMPAGHAAPAANEAPTQANASGKAPNDGFGKWMNEIFGSKKEQPKEQAAVPATASPAEPAPAPAATASSAAPAEAVQQSALPPVTTASAPELSPPAPVQGSSSQPSATASAPLPSVSALQAPAETGPASVNTRPLPDVSQLEKQDERPVHLVQPTDYAPSYSSEGYLGESRYAERGHAQSDN